MSNGYKRRKEAEEKKILEEWRQARFLAYTAALPNLKDKTMNIYKFFPLPGDPTDTEIKQQIDEANERESKWMLKVIEKVRNNKKRV